MRVYLGYDSPFLPKLVAHLLQDREVLAQTLVIVPTGQSGRMLREYLAKEAGALLAPQVTTPGALLHTDASEVAPSWLENIAWIETLESIPAPDWENYSALFPVPPAADAADWAVSLASEFVTLRKNLQDRLHNLFSASKFLASTPESARWEDLAKLETLTERRLSSWGYTSRTAELRSAFRLPRKYSRIVLAGITAMPACLVDILENFVGDVTSLIAAPESEAENFSSLGLPLDSWATRQLPLHATVSITADPQSQAMAALQAAASTGGDSSDIALGSADDHAGAALARIFTDNGWTAFHPAAVQPPSSLVRWLGAWKNWLSKPSSLHLATLFSLPESSALIAGNRAQKFISLNKIRDMHPSIEPEEILRRLQNSADADKLTLHAAILSLLEGREAFLRTTFPEAIDTHLRALGTESELVPVIDEFLSTASNLMTRLGRSHIFWLRVLLSELPAPTAHPPDDRIIDVQGWLELLFEPGSHLVVCGMNETFVPTRSMGDPWLSENARRILGLSCDSDRHSRDSYLLHAMLMMRKNTGTSHLICGKNGADGQPLLPSRLLLQVPRNMLPTTVRNLFREIEPPEANLVWTRDIIWQPPLIEMPTHFGVTSLRDYLACPFRFYLKHLIRMSESDPDRREMDARDFGNITHLVLENWGKDPEANKLTDPAKLTYFFESGLDAVIFREFGKQPPLAIRIQTQAIRQRLEWFAARQAEVAAEGWEIIAVERSFEFKSADFTLRGKIDRIDRHRATGQIRVIDYKTGDVKKGVESEHRCKITAATKPPQHIPDHAPPFHIGTDARGKPAPFLWQNLQLPLYVLALSQDKVAFPETPSPCYIHLGKTEDHVKFTLWDSFSESDLTSAQTCADWIITQISQRNFWPPSEKVSYDDYGILSQGRPLAEAFLQP